MTIDIYIDSDVLVSSEISSENNHKESKKFVKFVLNNDIKNVSFYTSGFTLLETVCAIRRRTKDKHRARSLAWQLARSWKEKIKSLELPNVRSWVKILDKLVETAIELGIPTGDIIHAQIIIERQIDYLVTWNKKHFKPLTRKVRKLKIVTPTEFLKDIEKLRKRADKNNLKSIKFYLNQDLIKELIKIRNLFAHNYKVTKLRNP